jgi:hypothetical protein
MQIFELYLLSVSSYSDTACTSVIKEEDGKIKVTVAEINIKTKKQLIVFDLFNTLLYCSNYIWNPNDE